AWPGETLWQVAKRAGETIPHLCFKDASGYRADGNCRACMVEIEGERVLAASCLREARPEMVVRSQSSERARVAREGVLELLLSDQPPRDDSPDRASQLWQMADHLAVDATRARARYPRRRPDVVRHAPGARLPGQCPPIADDASGRSHASATAGHDTSHPAMTVNLDACIHCTLCVRACREVQVNDVIGMAHRGAASKVVF
ncbi:2Fe-2S iron-sulfur cluster-binding protein, partial [Parasedimentitalea maritima]